MSHWMKFAVPLMALAGVPSTSAAEGPAKPAAVQSVDLRQTHDARLQGLLELLARDGVVGSSPTALQAQGADATVIVVPLARASAPDTLLHLFYLPEPGAYLFLQVGRGPDGREELRLWGAGRAEILVSADETVLLPAPSARTFRLPEEATERLGLRRDTSDLTADEILACLARTIGITWNPATLASLLGSLACSAAATREFVLTACNCLSLVGIGANTLFAPVGCFQGMASLIACGLARCTPAANAPPAPAPTSCGVEALALNQSVSGSWTSGCQATHRAGRYARYYAFDLPSGGSVRVTLRSSVDTYLLLLRGRGTGGAVMAENDDTFLSTNSEIGISLPAGAYTIEATTYGANVTGSFTLSLTR